MRHYHDVAAELGPCIQAAHAMVGQRHLARHRHLAATDQPDIRDGVMRSATREGRDPRRTGACQAVDAVDARCGEGFGRSIAGRRVVNGPRR
jgi:hypothetical protein